MKGKWTKQLCQIEANKYTTKKDFRKNAYSTYSACKKNKWTDEVCKHMIEIRKPNWTKQSCHIEALKYNSRSEFQKNASGAYDSCWRNDWLGEVCTHMIKKFK